jgi:cobalt transporter subunit CbtA
VVRETVLASAIAGLAAALVFTLIQSVWVTPLILQGESYEEAAEHADADSHHHVVTHADAEHHPDEWKPQDGWQRMLFTFGANLLMGVGYAFVLVAIFLFWREPKNALGGAAYGLAGFLVFFAAPGLGLPPELPGTAAAELLARQQWWAMTAAATGVGLFLLFSQSRWWLRSIALALIVAPHLVPAPHPAVEASLAPAELQSQFRIATTVCNAAFWVALGVASGAAFRKLVTPGSASHP